MRVYADLQIHSKYSRATSQEMDIRNIAFFAAIKGLDVVGTGDILHPRWFEEVSHELVEDGDAGLYQLRDKPDAKVRFMVTTEVSTVYLTAGKSRKVHHCLLLPSLDVAHQVADALDNLGDLSSDGRPILSVSSAELVERVLSVSSDIEVFPAHAWTPWWSIFGSVSGFDSLHECYEDQVSNIHALETGLSSDPPMNWRLSALDRFTLLSNSDCHSPYPHRLGREANVFELEKLSYDEILKAIREKDPSRLLHTIETKPEYGKYHWTGHRDCGVSMPPAQALRLSNRCPKCGKLMARGVDQRVEQLADRPRGFKPTGVPGFRYLLPLHEIIAAVLGEANPMGTRIAKIYNSLVRAFRNEFEVCLETSLERIGSVAGKEIAAAIEAVRNDTIKVEPGYDGIYGRISLSRESKQAETSRGGADTRLSDFLP